MLIHSKFPDLFQVVFVQQLNTFIKAEFIISEHRYNHFPGKNNYGYITRLVVDQYKTFEHWPGARTFSHTFSPESAHVGGPRPPNGCTPPTGNPGSATAFEYCKYCVTSKRRYEYLPVMLIIPL